MLIPAKKASERLDNLTFPLRKQERRNEALARRASSQILLSGCLAAEGIAHAPCGRLHEDSLVKVAEGQRNLRSILSNLYRARWLVTPPPTELKALYRLDPARPRSS